MRFVFHRFFRDGSNNFDLIYLGNPLQGSSKDLILCEQEIHCKGQRLDLVGFDLEGFATRVFERRDLMGTGDLLQGSKT